jgi:hypothetical protein
MVDKGEGKGTKGGNENLHERNMPWNFEPMRKICKRYYAKKCCALQGNNEEGAKEELPRKIYFKVFPEKKN